MNIEQANGNTNESASSQTSESKLQQLIDNLFKGLKNLNERKDNAEMASLTSLLKKAAKLIGEIDLKSILDRSDNIYALSVREYLSNPVGTLSTPKTEYEITLALFSALLLYKSKQYAAAQVLLHTLLFDRPHNFAQRTYLEQLVNFLFYKYLNCIEFSNSFEQQKSHLYLLLRELQAYKSEVLFCTLYIFILRNLILSRQLKEAHQLIKNWAFPESIQYIYFTKYLFYKGLFFGLVGQFQKSYQLMNDAFRKVPENKDKLTNGLKNFVLLIQKHMIVLNLLLNELPSIEIFAEVPRLKNYKELVKVVSQGHNEEFSRFLNTHKNEFTRDFVYPLLLKMRAVVLRNAVKKLSIAYTRISIPDVLTKIGIKQGDNFDLQSFLAKSTGYIEDFTIDPNSNVIDFARSSENYSDAIIRETLTRRIDHLNILEEQIVKSLKYPENHAEHKEKAEEDDDMDDLDFSFDDLEI